MPTTPGTAIGIPPLPVWSELRIWVPLIPSTYAEPLFELEASECSRMITRAPLPMFRSTPLFWPKPVEDSPW